MIGPEGRGRLASGLALTVAAAAVLMTLRAIAPMLPVLRVVAVLAWFAIPGVVLAVRLYRRAPGRWIAACLVAPAWGYVLGSLVLLALWAAGVRQHGWLLASPAIASVLVWAAGALSDTLTLPTFDRRDVPWVASVLLAVLVIVAVPFAKVGAHVPEGRAYRAYFTADFVWAMAVVSEVSKGDVPPENPYFAGDTLHYYWLMHLLPAVEHGAHPDAVSLEQRLLVNALWAALSFGAFLYFFVRHFVDRPWAAAAGCTFVFFCSSFEGIERIWAGVPFEALRNLNIDAVANWVYQGMKVDGLQRLVLYQPQHELGYVLGLSAFLLVVQARDASRAALMFLAGVFLGGAMLLSSVGAAILALATAIYEGVRLFRARAWMAVPICAVAAAIPMGLALGISTYLAYVDTVSTGNPLLVFGLNPLAARRVSWTMFLNFGPVLLLAAVGVIAVMWRHAVARFLPLAAVVGVSALAYFYVDVPDHDSVYVAWRTSHVAFIALAALCGFGLQEGCARPGRARWAIAAGTIVVAALALPTVVLDIYNTQDVANRAMGPGFRWTVILDPAEQEGLAWIRRNIAPNARVQVDPRARGRDTWAYVPAFAERRMAGGLPIGMIPVAKYEQISDELQRVYASASGAELAERALDLCVDYLIVGDPERRAHPRLQDIVDGASDVIRPAFRNAAMGIYGVSGSWERAACPHR